MSRLLKRLALLLFALVAVGLGVPWGLLRGSLPALDGAAALPGLSAPVTVARDALGSVTIKAANETDAMRALGYVHAQERYFEMDLMRRTAGGELAELFGAIALDTDRRHRLHRMRARAVADLDAIAGDRLPQLRAYTEGVNAGLAGLRVRPWPYLLLRQSPRAWTPADSALVGFAMYFDLQDSSNARELALWKLRARLPPALSALLSRDGTRWDAPLAGTARGDAPLPTAAQVDLRRLPAPVDAGPRAIPAKGTPGSNSFAVSGALTRDGRAIVADDMHLGLRAPNIWFRARLHYADRRATGGRVDVSGFTLPGLPAVVVGSNTQVAWGFTNSYIDALDWARVRPCNGARAASACDQVTTHRETIAVAGGDAVGLDVEDTAWGPIMHRQPDGTALALRWIAHLRGALNLGLAGFAHARDLDEALVIADRSALPTQNLVIADRGGRIAWRLLGPIALRDAGCGGGSLVIDDARDAVRPAALPFTTPTHSAADRSLGSSFLRKQESSGLEQPGTRTPDDPLRSSPMRCAPWPIATATSPLLASPTVDRVWTANARVVDGGALARIGDGGYAFGARARQIRDGLFAKQGFTEYDLLAIQLDDRAVFMAAWWRLLRETATQGNSPALRELADAAARWLGRASIDSAGYRIVRAWRLAVHARIVEGLTGPARAVPGEDFVMPDLPQFEGVAWPLVMQRPAHLLSRRFATWEALFEDAAKEVRDELRKQGPLAQRSWGERNTAAICHPLAGAVPLLGRRALCMPPDPLPGDGAMPRVQGPAFGASERMVVSPGHERDGIVHMPGGQSGHPLSPFWGAGHGDWVRGRPTPFLPATTRHSLRLSPATVGATEIATR